MCKFGRHTGRTLCNGRLYDNIPSSSRQDKKEGQTPTKRESPTDGLEVGFVEGGGGGARATVAFDYTVCLIIILLYNVSLSVTSAGPDIRHEDRFADTSSTSANALAF